MATVEKMLHTHKGANRMGGDALSRCAEECFDCAAVCVSCADACLSEDKLDMLVQCIRLDLDCADICEATGRVAVRMAGAAETGRHLLQACAAICTACGDECEKHASKHEHCRICAESCRRCAAACEEVLGAL